MTASGLHPAASGLHPAASVDRGNHANSVPRLALSVAEACVALGVSWDFYNEHVAHELRIVRRGRRKLVPVTELQAWLERNAARAVER